MTQPGSHKGCPFCNKPLLTERAILKHNCKQMVRHQEVLTVTGQRALNLYQLWFRHQGRVVPSTQTFKTSQMYTSFINFARFCESVDLVNPERFVQLMTLKQLPPKMWCMDEVYSLYMEFIDAKVSPLENVRLSVDTIISMSEQYQCDVADIFDVVDFPTLIQKIRTRRLSPWLLLFSKRFKAALDSTNVDNNIITQTLMRPNYWIERKKQHQDVIPDIKRIVQALGI